MAPYFDSVFNVQNRTRPFFICVLILWEVFPNSGRDEKSWIQLTQRDGKQIVGGSCSRNHHGLDSDLPDKYTNTLIYKNTNTKTQI